jgi:hypothetical protein
MRIYKQLAGAAAGGLLMLSGAMAATVPVSQSFELFDHDYSIVTEADWSGAAEAGVVSTNASVIEALTTYTNAGGVFPLPSATHAKVLALSDVVSNSVASATGGVVVAEWLLLPSQRDKAPAGSDENQMAFYVSTNSELVVWHRNTGGTPTNEWLTLSGNPAIGTSDWVRVTIHQDYVTDRYQIAINGTNYTHALGETRAGANPGSWFHMVQTNGYLSGFCTLGEKLTYVDDLVFTNRAVSYSGTTFAEAAANNGTIATTNTITLSGDTFVDTTYSAGTHFITSGVPAGLSVALAYVSPTQIEISLTGTANPHTAAAGTSAMGLTLEDALFTLGSAADVTGYTRGDLTVSFDDPPVLAYDPTTFAEAVANNGSIGNTVSVTLTGDTFAAGPFVAGTHFTTSGVPAGLTAVVTRNNETNLTVELTDAADAHGVGDSTTISLELLDDAFTTVAAANITDSTKNLDITFADSAALSYSTTTYSETAANDGSVSGGTIALVVKTFAGPVGTNYVLGGEVLVDHLPAGLEVAIVKDSDYQVSVSFSGAATAHTAADGTNNLTFTFQDAAFNGGGAAGVTGYARNDLAIVFNDPPVLDYSTTAFAEASANNGTIGNSVTATLTGDTLTGGARTLASPTDYSVTSGSVPAGLSLRIVSDGSTGLTISLDDSAASHAAANAGAFDITFASALFSAVAAANITGSSQGFTVSFDNQPTMSYSRTVFSELNAGTIDNTTPMEITISGDTFTGANGSDFVAAGKVTPDNVPAGLTLVLTKSSSTKLLATLTGTALAHADGDDVLTMGITFQDSAISVVAADQVTGYARSDLQVLFDDSALLINTVPYRESFEPYADGYALGPDEGWQPSGGGVVTSETAIVSELTGSFSEFPLATNHTQVLRMSRETTAGIKSGSGGKVYTDVMLYVTAREEAPTGGDDYQFAIFVDTDQHLNVWHRDTSATPTNTWATLSGVTVTTGAWHRVTVEKDYAAGKYRLYLDRSETPVSNPTTGGNWFNMVSTANNYLSWAIVQGARSDVPVYVDDLVVDTARPGFIPIPGSLFMFR